MKRRTVLRKVLKKRAFRRPCTSGRAPRRDIALVADVRPPGEEGRARPRGCCKGLAPGMHGRPFPSVCQGPFVAVPAWSMASRRFIFRPSCSSRPSGGLALSEVAGTSGIGG